MHAGDTTITSESQQLRWVRNSKGRRLVIIMADSFQFRKKIFSSQVTYSITLIFDTDYCTTTSVSLIFYCMSISVPSRLSQLQPNNLGNKFKVWCLRIEACWASLTHEPILMFLSLIFWWYIYCHWNPNEFVHFFLTVFTTLLLKKFNLIW